MGSEDLVAAASPEMAGDLEIGQEAPMSRWENAKAQMRENPGLVKKVLIGGMAFVGLVAMIGVAATGGSAGGFSGSAGGDTTVTDGTDAAAFLYPVEEFGVQGMVMPYPGSTHASYPTGYFELRLGNILAWEIHGLAPNKTYPFHIHEGTSCETGTGGHYYNGPTDGWGSIMLQSDAHGNSMGQVDVDEIEGAYSFMDNVNHAVVLHNAAGRFTCAHLSAYTDTDLVILAEMATFPGYEGSYPTGVIMLSYDNVMSVMLEGASDSMYSIHIHEGVACDADEVGPHYYMGNVTDPWLGSMYNPENNTIMAEYDLAPLEGTYPFLSNIYHAVVVHDSTGTKVACGVLKPYREEEVVEPEEPEDPIYPELPEDELPEYSVKGWFDPYPGLNETEITAPCGKVYLESDNSLQYYLRHLEPEEPFYMHIHDATTCEEDTGAHHYQGAVDGWAEAKFYANEKGKAWGRIDLNEMAGAFPFVANLDKIVVIHNKDKVKVACTELRAKEDYGVEAYLEPFNGYTGDAHGTAKLDSANVLSFRMFHMDENIVGGIHIHEGTSCTLPKGHYYKKDSTDFWADSTKYYTNDNGRAAGMFSLDNYEGAYDFPRNSMRVVVVHDQSGTPILCGKLHPYVFYSWPESLEFYETDQTVKGRFYKYENTVVEEGPYPRGFVYVNSENVMIWDIRDLEPGSQGGIHIHANRFSCDDVGPHWYVPGGNDPWVSIKWTSTLNGRSDGVVDVNTLLGAYGYPSNINHAVAIHNSAGQIVSCAVLRAVYDDDFGVKGTMQRYPGLSEEEIYPEGTVFLSSVGQKQYFSWVLYELPAEEVVSIHIHTGKSCDSHELVGGHYYIAGESDYWTDYDFNRMTNEWGHYRGRVLLNNYDGAYTFDMHVDHAVVVHDSTGKRIGCTTLTYFLTDIEADYWDWVESQESDEN